MRLIKKTSLRKIVEEVDLVLEIVDVRDPVSTRSTFLERLVEKLNKKLLIILNKCDLVPNNVVRDWRKIFSSEGFETLAITAFRKHGVKMLKKRILEVADKLNKPVKVAVVGVPKVGKSTVINALKGRHSAPTSPYPGSPGYTKGVQLLKIDEGVYLLDTPGTVPLKKAGVEAVIRSKPVEKLDNPVGTAVDLIRRVLKYNPKAFEETYLITEKDPEKILEKLAIKRGWFYKKDKDPLIEEAARTVIRDYLRGKIRFFLPPNEYAIKNGRSA